MSESQHDPQGPQRAGERLKAAREAAGMSITQVADQLRLSGSVVEALEQGQYGVIGAQVFVRGYLKRYADLVGEDTSLADAATQQHAWGAATTDLTSTRLRALDGTGDRVRIGRWPLVVAAVLLALWGIYWWAQRASAPRAAAPSTDVVQEQVVTSPALGVASGAATLTASAPAATPAPAHAAAAATATPAPSSTGAARSAQSTAAPAVATPAPASRPAAAAAPAVAAPGAQRAPAGNESPRKLRLNFHGESWTELYDAGGTRLYWGLGEPGDLQAVSGTPPFKLILGNPGAVTVSFEGTALALPAPRGGTTLRVGIDGRGALEPLR